MKFNPKIHWKTSDGTIIPVGKMTNRHLANAILLLERTAKKHDADPSVFPVYPALMDEVNKRGFDHTDPRSTSPEWWDLYARYLASNEWRERREAAMSRAKGVCEHCAQARATVVHHLTYERVFNERPDDLVALCDPCHEREHEK